MTTLLRMTLAVGIASIGGDGTTTTVLTAAPHQLIDGDWIAVSGTTAYNTTPGVPVLIDVIATNELRYASPVAAAVETHGMVRTGVIALWPGS